MPDLLVRFLCLCSYIRNRLLWEDPFYAFLSPQYSSTYNLEAHYSDLVSYLLMATAPGDQIDSTIGQAIYPFNKRLKLPCYLAQVLALKCHLRDWLFQAYRLGDKDQLRRLAGREPETRLSLLRSAVESLWLYHRDVWMSTYKPFGWAELDIRLVSFFDLVLQLLESKS